MSDAQIFALYTFYFFCVSYLDRHWFDLLVNLSLLQIPKQRFSSISNHSPPCQRFGEQLVKKYSWNNIYWKKRYWHLPPPCQRFVAQLNNSNLIRKILTPSPHIKMSHFPSIAFKHLSIKTREADSSEEVFIGPSVFLSQMSSERVKESVGLVTFRIKATKRGLANFKHLPPTLETKYLLLPFSRYHWKTSIKHLR